MRDSFRLRIEPQSGVTAAMKGSRPRVFPDPQPRGVRASQNDKSVFPI